MAKFQQKTAGSLTVTGYEGRGSVLLAFDLPKDKAENLAGFSVERRDADTGTAFQALPNRLNFSTGLHNESTIQDRKYTDSTVAPFQKFRWVDFPPANQTGKYEYRVTVKYFGSGDALVDGDILSIELSANDSNPYSGFKYAFTKGYMSSQAFDQKFKGDNSIRPNQEGLFDTTPYLEKYQWLGGEARSLVFDFLDQALNDESISLDMFAYDLDEPDIVNRINTLAAQKRLRIIIDDASLHTKAGSVESLVAAQLNQANAGTAKRGHFRRFSHDKIMIQKKDGKAIRVLTGSANFSIRGLYVQSNNILMFDDPETAGHYREVFEAVWSSIDSGSMMDFAKSPKAANWITVNGSAATPKISLCFSPHAKPAQDQDGVSISRISAAIRDTKSSILFAVMQMGGGGSVLKQLNELGKQPNLFFYGVTQNIKETATDSGEYETSGVTVMKPEKQDSGEVAVNGVIAEFSYLKSMVPPPFDKEVSGGSGIVIHDKFIVIDFNTANPILYTGSSNLAELGEEENGDNLLEITDPAIVTAYAIEAIRLVDHYHFRTAMKTATREAPMTLSKGNWWSDYYDPENPKYYDRITFSA